MKNKRGFKHYLKFYALIVIVYFIYVSILAITNGGYDPVLLLSIGYLPIMFIFFVFMFDTLLDPLFNRFKKPKTNEASLYKEFFQKMTYEVNEQCDFTIEDFRRLRENEKFQKGLQQAFKIKNNGETNELNFVLLEKKFKKNTREYQAMIVVINEVKKMMAN